MGVKLGGELLNTFKLQVIYYANASFYTFIALEMWLKSEDPNVLFLYTGTIFTMRLVMMFFSAYLILKGKLNIVMTTSFVASLLLSLSVITLNGQIDNFYILMILYAFLISIMTTFFAMSNSQKIAKDGTTSHFEYFFYLSEVSRNAINVILPVIVGVLISLYSVELAFGVLLILSVLSIIVSVGSKEVGLDMDGKRVRDIFKRTDISIEEKKVATSHYIFIFISGSLIQFLDVMSREYQFVLGENALKVGLLESLFVVLIYLILKQKEKLNLSNTFWYYAGSIGLLVGVVLIYLGWGGLWSFLIILLLFLTLYIIQGSSNAISFKLIDNKTDFDKFSLLFKREFVRSSGKVIMSIIALIGLASVSGQYIYNMFLVFVGVMILVGMYLYQRLERVVLRR